ncbi:distal tail protein Dit [Parageobacillus toebii]|uniref:distal tail protein Dit n=1 Tax=Parageobacillus toebii TaxID=153151 RepID=UPI002815F6E4|nr:distal tail protein Dit [Parageobacillus toebii]WMT19143.1 phage tail family protein [Parageobacillus toebii]
MSFSFNGETRDYLKVLRGRKRPAWASVTRGLLIVPGKPGGYLQNTAIQPRTIDVPVMIEGENIANLQKIKEDLAAWLVTDEPKELIFDDESDRTYFAIVDETLDLDELVRVGQGIIRFICPDPYKYGQEKIASFPSDNVLLNYKGTEKGDPIFQLEVLQPVTFAMIQNDDEEYIMAGQVVNLEEQEPVAKEQLIFWSEADTLTGWTTGTRVDGTISGSIQTDGYRFYPASYGTSTGWHGPAVKTSLPEPLDHFRVDAIVEFYNSVATVGRVEIYLLDDADDIIGKIALKDITAHYAETYGEARAGDIDVHYHLINETGATPTTWANFYGLLQIGRYGNQWFAYIAKIDKSTGRRHARMYRSWIDTEGHFTSKRLAQVMVHFGQLKTHAPVPTRLEDIKVYKWNPTTDVQVPYIAYEGDVITFDHKEKNILINGEPRLDLKDFGARFFKLKPGENTLIVLPEQSFNVTCRYRERFK